MPSDEPSDAQIEKCLHGVVKSLLRTGNGEQLTVKNARSRAEEALDLPVGFFKTHDQWKDRSKEVIEDFASKLQDGVADEDSDEPNDDNPKPNGASSTKRGTKRASDDFEDRSKPQQRKKVKVAAKEAESGGEDDEDDEDDKTSASAKTKATSRSDPRHDAVDDGDDLSSLSDVRDSPPPQRKKKRKSNPGATEAPSKFKSKSTAKPSKTSNANEPSSQEAEIKRLQSQLVKCGIRKLWHRELAPYQSDKAKIAHLRGMLADAGIEGRFSEDKARQIKEKRELAADLEAVTEGNKMWGQSGDEDDNDGEGTRPKRRLAKGLRDISAFISDGEETD